MTAVRTLLRGPFILKALNIQSTMVENFISPVSDCVPFCCVGTMGVGEVPGSGGNRRREFRFPKPGGTGFAPLFPSTFVGFGVGTTLGTTRGVTDGEGFFLFRNLVSGSEDVLAMGSYCSCSSTGKRA